MYFNDTEIYNIESMPLFSASDEAVMYFNRASIHDIDAIADVGFLDLISSSSAIIDNSKIFNINLKRKLDVASFINFSSTSSLIFNNTESSNIKIDGDFVLIESKDKNSNSLLIYDSTFKDIVVKTGSIIKMATNQCKFQIENSKFLNNNRICDDNDDVTSCYGIIFINTDIGESTIDSCLFQNNTSGIGPALTILNIDNIQLNIQNSKFIKNVSTYYGGALYIHGNSYTGSDNLKMRNLEFDENQSNSGGAIFIDFPGYNKEVIEKTKFVNNQANNGGGVFYFPFNVKKNQPKLDKNCVTTGNRALFGNITSSDPYQIVLQKNSNVDITKDKENNKHYKMDTFSGDSKSFVLELRDEFGNIVSTNFGDANFSLQNMVFIKASLVSKNNTNDSINLLEKNNVIDVVGETFGYFQNGVCPFSMQFYSNTVGNYTLMVNVSLSAYTSNSQKQQGHDNLYFVMDLNMNECQKGLVLKDDVRSKFQTCQEAICELDKACVSDQGRCIKDNECECYPGYQGSNCEAKIFCDIPKGLTIYRIIVGIIGISMTSIFFIFLLIMSKKYIVKISKITHLGTVAFGCILGFTSIMFDYREPKESSCIIRDTTLNFGYILIYTIFYLKMYTYIISNVPENLSFSSASLLKSNPDSKNGNNNGGESMEVSKFDMSMDVRSGFNFVATINSNTNNRNSADIIKQTNQGKKEVENIANNIFRKQYMDGLKKNFNRIFIFIYILFSASLILTICLYIKKGLNSGQMSDNCFATVCESLIYSPVQYAIHLLFLAILSTNVKKIWALSGMFAEIKHLCYATVIWITIGPLVQLICQTMLKQNPSVRMLMMVASVFLSNFFIAFFLLGLKTIAILRGGGDSSNYSNSKFTQFYNEPSVKLNNQGETTNSFKQ